MSLSEFMPYGAPELLEGAAPRMARSTMLATGLVMVLTWSAGLVAMRQPHVIELPGDLIPVIEIQPPPRLRDESGRRERTAPEAPIIDPSTFVRPVDEEPPVVPPPIDAGKAESNQPPGREGPDSPPGIVGQGPCVCGGGEPVTPEYFYHDVEPELVTAKDPVYPDFAREAGVEGNVVVWMLVGLDGRVESAVIHPPGRPTMLDQAALIAARTSVYTPALANGHPVRVWVSRTYRFKLH
jgi:protein TonB